MTDEHRSAGMEMHLRVKSVEQQQERHAAAIAAVESRHRKSEHRQDLIEKAYSSLERDVTDVQKRLSYVEELVGKNHESILDMFEGVYRLIKSVSQSIKDLVDYRPELLRLSGFERYKAETWVRLKSISIKFGIMAAIVGPLYLLWSNWPRP